MFRTLAKQLNSENRDLRLEAADSLAELVEKSPKDVKAAATAPLLKMSESDDILVASKAYSVLCKLMSKDKQFKKEMLERGIIEKLYNLMENDKKKKKVPVQALNDISSAFFCISYYFYEEEENGLPETLSQKYVDAILPALKKFLHHNDIVVASYAVAALLTLIEVDNKFGVDYGFVDAELIKDFIRFLSNKNLKIRGFATEALRNLANFPNYTMIMFENGILKPLPKLLEVRYNQIIVDALWIISMVADISDEYCQRVWGARLSPIVIKLLSPPSQQLEQIQAAQTINSLAKSCTPNQALYLLNQDVVENVCRILLEAEAQENFPPLRTVMFQGLYYILEKLVDQEEFYRRLKGTGCEEMFKDVAMKS